MSIASETYYSDLFPAHQRLVRLMQTIGFGRIERVTIRGGEPILGPDARAIRTLRLSASGGTAGARPEAGLADFELKRELVDLFALLGAVGDGVIPRLDVAHGLPLMLEVEQPTAPFSRPD